MNTSSSTTRAIDALLETAEHHATLEREAHEGRDWNHLFTLAIFALFVGALLGAIVMGTSAYRSIQNQVDEVNNRRLTLDLLANSVRANDTAGAVGVGIGPEGNSLVLTEALASGSYETRFYLYEGNLLEEYALAGTSCTPANATILAPTEVFEFSYDSTTGLLTVVTDQGSRDIALRSAQGSTHDVMPADSVEPDTMPEDIPVETSDDATEEVSADAAE